MNGFVSVKVTGIKNGPYVSNCSLMKFEVSISSTKLNYIIPVLGVRFCFKIFILLARLSAAFDIKGL